MIFYTDFNELNSPFGLIIGNFDGIHLGHRKLIDNFIVKCTKNKLTPVLLTFRPHPKFFFTPDLENFLITGKNRKNNLLFQVGVEKIIELEFNEELQKLSSNEFLEKYIFSQKSLEYLAIGHDFALGSGKEDSIKQAKRLCEKNNVLLTQEKSFLFEGKSISSTSIREIIREGDIEKANRALGRNFKLNGLVVEGAGIGRKSLFPTINLKKDKSHIIPNRGVYLTLSLINGKYYQSLTNIGIRPTIEDDNNLTIETHVLNFDQDVYGKSIEIEFLKKLRAEKKFGSIESLKMQIESDISFAQRYFAAMKRPSLALVGFPVEHSQSPNIYERLLDKSISYDLLGFENKSEVLTALDLLQKYQGISITSPYKKHFLDQVQIEGDFSKAINVLFKKNGKAYGTNTDYIASETILSELVNLFGVSKILLLGDGSMAEMLVDMIKKKSLPLVQYSRKINNLDQFYRDIRSAPDNCLVINSCSRDFDFQFTTKQRTIVWDLNYNSDAFDKFKSLSNIVFVDGLSLLEKQAKNALNFWNLASQ